MQFTKIVSRAEGRTRTDNIIITNDSQLPIVLHRQKKNTELLTDMTGTQQGEKVFNLQAYYYATYCTLTIQSWQHPLAHWNSFVLVGFSKGKRIIER